MIKNPKVSKITLIIVQKVMINNNPSVIMETWICILLQTQSIIILFINVSINIINKSHQKHVIANYAASKDTLLLNTNL